MMPAQIQQMEGEGMFICNLYPADFLVRFQQKQHHPPLPLRCTINVGSGGRENAFRLNLLWRRSKAYATNSSAMHLCSTLMETIIYIQYPTPSCHTLTLISSNIKKAGCISITLYKNLETEIFFLQC